MWKERSCLEESSMLSISTQIQACSRALGGVLSRADTWSSISHSTSSLQLLEDLAAAPRDPGADPTSHSLPAIAVSQPAQLCWELQRAPSAVLSPLCAHPAACGNAPATHNPSCSPTAVAQTLAYFTLQEQEEAMALLLSCSFSRLALALCTLQGVGPAKPLTAMQGQSLPPP